MAISAPRLSDHALATRARDPQFLSNASSGTLPPPMLAVLGIDKRLTDRARKLAARGGLNISAAFSSAPMTQTIALREAEPAQERSARGTIIR